MNGHSEKQTDEKTNRCTDWWTNELTEGQKPESMEMNGQIKNKRTDRRMDLKWYLEEAEGQQPRLAARPTFGGKMQQSYDSHILSSQPSHNDWWHEPLEKGVANIKACRLFFQILDPERSLAF